jgi:hypothetical protein
MMGIVEIIEQRGPLSARQRWSNYFVLIYGALALLIGINLRNSAINAVVPYENTQVGIQAFYPESWLIDTDGNYVFRVQDMSQPGFKTSIQVAVFPVSATTTDRNVLDALSLNRSQTLAAYSVLSISPYELPNNANGVTMSYTYVSRDTDPFLQSLPAVVEGQDILTINRGQVIVITFLSDSSRYNDNLPVFRQFLNQLEF